MERWTRRVGLVLALAAMGLLAAPVWAAAGAATAVAPKAGAPAAREPAGGGAATLKPLFTFGVITDVQYADLADNTAKKMSYRSSLERLKAAVETFNARQPAFVIHLGDLIEKDFASFEKVLPIWATLKMPHYLVVGNHDEQVEADKKGEWRKAMGLEQGHYEFARPGWRFAVLDILDKAGQAKQKEWLAEVLKKASAAGEKVIVFRHTPCIADLESKDPAAQPPTAPDRALAEMFEASGCVVAFMNGHAHKGGYVEQNGIHYVTFKGTLVNAEGACAIVSAYPDRLQITGLGNEVSRTLKFKPAAAAPAK